MNQTEKRRKELLSQARNMYSDRKMPPAVHPRFGNAYDELYGTADEEVQSTFGLRAMLCFLLFTAFIAIDYRGATIADVSSDKIVNAVTEQVDIKEVWKNL